MQLADQSRDHRDKLGGAQSSDHRGKLGGTQLVGGPLLLQVDRVIFVECRCSFFTIQSVSDRKRLLHVGRGIARKSLVVGSREWNYRQVLDFLAELVGYVAFDVRRSVFSFDDFDLHRLLPILLSRARTSSLGSSLAAIIKVARRT